MSPRPLAYDSARQMHPALREAQALVRYRDFVRQLVARNITVRYKRSILGFAWSMLAPLLTMVTLSLVFTHLMGSTAPDYPLYLFPGLLLWNFFAQTTSIITAEVIGGIDMWRRIYTPKGAFAVATALTGLVHLGAAMVPLALAMVALGSPFTPALLTLPITALNAALFALGVGLLVASVAGYFADVGDLFQVVLNTWMYFTPVIYPESIIPEGYRWAWRLNPMAHIVDAFRRPIYQHAAPSLELLALTTGLAALTLLAGWYAFTSRAEDLVRRG